MSTVFDDGAPVNRRALPSPAPALAVDSATAPAGGAAGSCSGSTPAASRCALRQ
jgi:hypothetical protein